MPLVSVKLIKSCDDDELKILYDPEIRSVFETEKSTKNIAEPESSPRSRRVVVNIIFGKNGPKATIDTIGSFDILKEEIISSFMLKTLRANLKNCVVFSIVFLLNSLSRLNFLCILTFYMG